MDDVATLVAQVREQATNHQLEAAAKLAKSALGLAPNDPSARLAMVFVRYQEKRIKPLEKAIASALEVVRDNTERARCHAYMASLYTYYSGGDVRSIHALAQARLAIELAPDYAAGHFELALALEKRFRYAAAVEAIAVACSLQPDKEYLREQKRLRQGAAGLGKSLAEARKAAEASPTSDTLSDLGSCHGYLDQFDDAIAAYDRAAALDRKHPGIKEVRKRLMIEAGRLPMTLKLKTEPKSKPKPTTKKPAAKKTAQAKPVKKRGKPTPKKRR